MSITKLDQMFDALKSKSKKRLVAAYANDAHTIGAVYGAVEKGLIDATLVGDEATIKKVCAEHNFDFSKFKMSQVNIDAGASSIKLKLGDLYSFTKVSVDAGASSIKIEIPKASGCEIKSDNFLSDKNFTGFNKIDDGTYRTSGFENALNKIMIVIDAGVSSIDVKRY